MYGFLIAVLVLDGIFLSVVILLQSGKGGGLAAVGGGAAMTEGILGGRQATTMLTRSTWTAGTIFMVLSLVLSIMSSRAQAPESVIQVPTPAGQEAPEAVIPGLDDGSGTAPAPAPVDAPAPETPSN
ncbi:MAG: preprotein translocase subunit SecG [Gemmatimonadota bacterium]|jgi:preprotein translocase subunit SecG